MKFGLLPDISMKHGLLLATASCEFTALPQKRYSEAPPRGLLSPLALVSQYPLPIVGLDPRRSTIVELLFDIALDPRTQLSSLGRRQSTIVHFFNLSDHDLSP